MDTRSSSLVVGLYLLGACVLAAIVGSAFFARGDRLREQFARLSPQERQSNEGPYLDRGALSRQEFLAAQNAAEVERLRQLLHEKDRELAESTRRLQEQTAAFRKLQKDFDDAAAIALQFLHGSASSPAESPVVAEVAANRASTPVKQPSPAEADTIALREELNKSRLLENALAAEVADLQAEVLAAEADLVQAQQTMRENAAQLAADERQTREASGAVLARVGEAAVPALVEALRDERAAVRRWAATVLAEMGPAAAAAIGPLMDALADSDESVRTAAATALRALETCD